MQAQRLNSADGKKRSFLTVRWNDLLGTLFAPIKNRHHAGSAFVHQPCRTSFSALKMAEYSYLLIWNVYFVKGNTTSAGLEKSALI
jgi:hypothetical protein